MSTEKVWVVDGRQFKVDEEIYDILESCYSHEEVKELVESKQAEKDNEIKGLKLTIEAGAMGCRQLLKRISRSESILKRIKEILKGGE